MIRYLPGLFALLVAAAASAAEPSLEVRLDPQRFGVEDTSRLVVTVVEPGRKAPRPMLGELENLKVVAGPSTENQFSWVNGVATSVLSFTYILQAQQVGAARVGTIAVVVDDKILRSEPISVEVVAGSVNPPRRSRRVQARPFDPFQDPFAEVFGQRQPDRQARIELRQRFASRKLFLGQAMPVTVVLDTTVMGIADFEWVEAPTYPGWWTQRVELPEQIETEIVEVDGIRFQRYIIARFILVPLRSGEAELPEIKARIGLRSRSIFARQQVVERAAPLVKIAVADRPTAPDGFSGAVGRLQYRARLEPESIELGQSAVLTVELSGEGNLPLVEAPTVWPSCEGCESYPPEEESKVKVTQSGIRGSRIWRKTLLPRIAGELSLEPVVLAVFDPSSGDYSRHTLGPLTLMVAEPPPTPTPVMVTATTSRGPGAGPEAQLDGEQQPVRRAVSPWFWSLLVAAAALLGGAVGAWLMARQSASGLPRRRAGQSPADRARELQMVLEDWWFEMRGAPRAEGLQDEMEALRRELESVRFAPGRADHTETINGLEKRLRTLIKHRP